MKYLREEEGSEINKPNAGLSVQMYEEAKWPEVLHIFFSCTRNANSIFRFRSYRLTNREERWCWV
jgi:hypothetical protein